MSFEWAVAVTTAPREPATLLDTLRSITRAGWEWIHLYSEPGVDIDSVLVRCHDLCEAGDLPLRLSLRPSERAERIGSWPNFRRALAGLVKDQPNANAYVVFQDDVEVSVGLREWLERELWPGDDARGQVGVVSLYTASPLHHEDKGWHLLSHEDLPKRAYGALAYVFPPAAAKLLLAKNPEPGSRTKTDLNVGKWAKTHGLEYWLHSPSFVRHTGERSTLHNHPITEYRQCKAFIPDVRGLGDLKTQGEQLPTKTE